MVELRERKTEIGIGLFLLVGIGAWLMIPSVFPADTIILVNPDTGGGPVSCLPSGALILAQNLTDLCDVTIVNATNGQIIEYNGTQWINVNPANFTDTTVCLNQTTGHGLCINDLIELKNLATCDACYIGITSNATHVSIFNLGVVELIASDGITIDQPTGVITVSSFCDNIGTGIAICDGDNNINSLIAGTGITVTDTVDDITLASQCANTGTGEAVCESANNINSLIAGDGIAISDTTGDLTIRSTGYVEIERQSPSDGASTFTTDTFTAYKYLRLQLYIKGDATGVASSGLEVRFNGDTGTNYNERISSNNGADTTAVSQTSSRIGVVDEAFTYLCTSQMNNISTEFKSLMSDCQQTNTSIATATVSSKSYDAWGNSASQVTSITILIEGGGFLMDSTSELIVYGAN